MVGRYLIEGGVFLRIFVDSSTIIALSKIGELSFIRNVYGYVFITDLIEKELLRYEFPETEAIRKAIGDWIEVVPVEGDLEHFRKFGLDRGEASLFLLPEEDQLIIDDLNARGMAKVECRHFSGLLGIIVASVEKGMIDKKRGQELLDKLARSNFRMTVSLYNELQLRITGHNPR
jgi:predicted nucleic acid-binding protein